MSSYKPFPEYKESGVDWFGHIPESWKFVRIWQVFEERSELNNKMLDLPLLTVSINTGVGFYEEKGNINVKAEDERSYQICKEDDIVYNKMRMWQGAVGVAPCDGLISPAYQVLIPKKTVYTSYYNYLLKTDIYKIQALRNSYGITLDRNRLYWDKFKDVKLPLPPKPEQTAIAQFLDRKTAEIKAFIELKEKTIELLKERKTAIINQAVTKGLDPTVAMKDSGIEWLGEIPMHWEVKKLKYISKINPSKGTSRFSRNSAEEVVFLPMERVSENGVISNELKKPIKELWEGFTYFEKHDVLLAKITPCFENGKGAYLNKLESEVGFGTTEFHVFRPNLKRVLAEFFYNILKSEMFMTLGEESMIGSAGQKRVPNSFISNFEAGFPSIEEQKDIAGFIKIRSQEIDQYISQAEKEIALIKEYQQSLISEAVTGKIDVRGWEAKGYVNTMDEMSMAAEPDTTYTRGI